MRTVYLDNEINELEALRSRGELTYMGGEKLSEFNEIKRALTLTDVGSSLPFENSESKLCKTCNGNGVMWFNKK